MDRPNLYHFICHIFQQYVCNMIYVNLKNQQDSSNLWPGYKNWCWLLIVNGIVKCNGPLNEFLLNLLVDSDGGREDTF